MKRFCIELTGYRFILDETFEFNIILEKDCDCDLGFMSIIMGSKIIFFRKMKLKKFTSEYLTTLQNISCIVVTLERAHSVFSVPSFENLGLQL